jgi:hypothetical protein
LGVFVLVAIALAPRLVSQSSLSRPAREGEWEDVDSL